jgi:hypothetical protein
MSGRSIQIVRPIDALGRRKLMRQHMSDSQLCDMEAAVDANPRQSDVILDEYTAWSAINGLPITAPREQRLATMKAWLEAKQRRYHARKQPKEATDAALTRIAESVVNQEAQAAAE